MQRVRAGHSRRVRRRVRFAWSLYAEFEYRFNPTWSAFVGSRVFAYDYENDGFEFDVTMHGPVIGVG